ncbi:dedicator of cytokinesis protein 11-like [Populus alba x Populus x berolinensis]|uniref:Dedicator of cytokinesis protein 11-like n=1 Tax=Populus alba x Populus x berolinensis TaxID=444605 RepID=A0AAD6QZ03_9ROSI|nr:dedicator of cytokinesis protein 11-like [Populus alba x Populus x berolinensis]
MSSRSPAALKVINFHVSKVCREFYKAVLQFKLIGEAGQDFHTQLVNGFQSLTAELSHYIPAILAEL